MWNSSKIPYFSTCPRLYQLEKAPVSTALYPLPVPIHGAAASIHKRKVSYKQSAAQHHGRTNFL